MKFAVLTFLSIIALFLAFTVVFLETSSTAYGVSYEWHGERGYSVVQGNPIAIIDELQSRQIRIINISPIR